MIALPYLAEFQGGVCNGYKKYFDYYIEIPTEICIYILYIALPCNERFNCAIYWYRKVYIYDRNPNAISSLPVLCLG